MFLNLFVILVILLNAALWGSKQKGRGVFSALLALACTLVSGGIAFALWEPLAQMAISQGAADYAWTLALLVPFALISLVLRVTVDSLVTKNLDFDDVLNFVGGAIFGAANGFIAAGIVVLGVGNLRVGSDVFGYKPVTYNGGSVVYTGKLWVPADRLTVLLYEKLSIGAFGTETPLALRMPRADEQTAMMRSTLEVKEKSQVARTTIKPSEFELKSRYQVVANNVSDLLSDGNLIGNDGKPKAGTSVYPDGTSPSNGDLLEGFVINFNSGAVEKAGQVVVGPSQMRLICRTKDGGAVGVHPIAIIAPPEAGAAMYRFRMDAPDIFIPSVGGGSGATFAFGFLVPKDSIPTDLIVKNTRLELPEAKPDGKTYVTLNGFAKRDEALKSGTLLGKPPTAPTATAGGKGAAPADTQIIKAAGANRFEGIEMSSSLTGNIILNAGDKGGLEVDSNNRITDGQHQWAKASLTNNRGIDKNLRIDSFATTKDTDIVQATLSESGALSLLGRSVESAENILPPALIDESGNRYEALGYIYDDGINITIRFKPGEPLRGLTELPSPLSRSKRDQTVRLIFRPTRGVKIVGFALGSKQLATFEPPLQMPK